MTQIIIATTVLVKYSAKVNMEVFVGITIVYETAYELYEVCLYSNNFVTATETYRHRNIMKYHRAGRSL